MIERDEKLKTKMSCLILRFFEKIKQVLSTKLTNWYKEHQLLRDKQILSPTYFPRCEPKSLKNIAPKPQSIFLKNEKLFFWKKLTKSKTPGLSIFKKKGT